jgi:prefoldin beta subunit
VCPLVSVRVALGKKEKKEAKREERKERSWHTKEARGFRVQSFWQRDHYHLIHGEWELNVSSRFLFGPARLNHTHHRHQKLIHSPPDSPLRCVSFLVSHRKTSFVFAVSTGVPLLDSEIKLMQEIQQDLQRTNVARSKLQVQLQENELVLVELNHVKLDAKSTAGAAAHGSVYKLIGPVLVKQDLDEAKANVQKRIDFIRAELKRLESKAADDQTKIQAQNKKMLEIQRTMQERMQRAAQQQQQQQQLPQQMAPPQISAASLSAATQQQ